MVSVAHYLTRRYKSYSNLEIKLKPKIFIASSVEGLDVAYAIQSNLDFDADITVWSQGVFTLSQTSLDSLVTELEASDFGIFVFTPDDETVIRGESTRTIRDNVLFELGLFIGKLGKDRCFFVVQDRTELHIPTDLYGITPARYRGDRGDNNIVAALGPACNDIRRVVRDLKSVSSTQETVNPEPVDEHLDDADIIAILEAWLRTDAIVGTAIRYSDVDKSVNLPNGSTKRLITQVFERNTDLVLEISGASVFKFSEVSPLSSYIV